MNRALRTTLLPLSLLAALAFQSAHAQAWPTKPIRWVVPYTAGGMTDTATRVVLQKVAEQNGWNFVFEYKPGANSMVGAADVARSAPDGYSFLTVVGGHASNATLYAGRMSFDPAKSFAPVSLVGISPLIVVATNSLPAKDFTQLIAYAKANPGKISFGSSGVGAISHLTGELLRQAAGIDMVHVPYKGFAVGLQDLMSGNIHIVFETPPSVMSHVRGGKIKALGLLAKNRVAGASEVPTIVEAGGPALESSTPVLFLAPAGTPADIVQRLSGAVAKALATPELKSRLDGMGIDPVGSTPEQARKFLDDEIAKWAGVIRSAGIKVE